MLKFESNVYVDTDASVTPKQTFTCGFVFRMAYVAIDWIVIYPALKIIVPPDEKRFYSSDSAFYPQMSSSVCNWILFVFIVLSNCNGFVFLMELAQSLKISTNGKF